MTRRKRTFHRFLDCPKVQVGPALTFELDWKVLLISFLSGSVGEEAITDAGMARCTRPLALNPQIAASPQLPCSQASRRHLNGKVHAVSFLLLAPIRKRLLCATEIEPLEPESGQLDSGATANLDS